jgi:hypothetical protein
VFVPVLLLFFAAAVPWHKIIAVKVTKIDHDHDPRLRAVM